MLRDCWYAGVDLEPDAPGAPIQDVHVLRNTFVGFNISATTLPKPANTGDTNGVEIRGRKTLTPGDTCMPTIWFGDAPENANRLLKVAVEDVQIKSLAGDILFDHVEGGSIPEQSHREDGSGLRLRTARAGFHRGHELHRNRHVRNILVGYSAF